MQLREGQRYTYADYVSWDDDDTVVQTDIVVICDKTKIDRRGCNGAPDMVVEVLSKSSARRDRILKLQKYQSAGVREYWLIDPESNTLHMYSDEDTVPVHVLDGCSIDMKEVFDVEPQNNATD